MKVPRRHLNAVELLEDILTVLGGCGVIWTVALVKLNFVPAAAGAGLIVLAYAIHRKRNRK